MKLHLGCGNTHIDGFLNIDLADTPAVDIRGDIRYLTDIPNNSAELIYACNVIEHIKRFEIYPTLRRWYEVLRPDGILRISTPDLEAVFKYYNKTKDLKGIYNTLYGGQKKEYSFHYHGWDFETLKSDLEKNGFRDVRRYDRSKTEHANVQDWSENYLPQIDKRGFWLYYGKWIKGINIALNVEALK